MTPVAVFDIEGVLSDPSHRLHYLEEHPKNWDSFYDEVGGDRGLTRPDAG